MNKQFAKLMGIFPILLIPMLAFGQQLTVKGKVTSAENGEILPGVTVRVKGASEGAVTNVDGRYSVTTKQGDATLVFTFTGYNSLEVPVNGRTTVDVVLQTDNKVLDEVVVVGYGTQQKANVAGAITSVKTADLKQTPISNVVQGIQGRVSGVQITQNSSAPGGSISMRIRGVNSINGTSEPLYVVDGVQLSNSGGVNDISSLSIINPNDIESVAVLKDASATAIYGARGANGVVLITTKRGKAGKTMVTYDGYYGVQNTTKRMNMMNAAEFAALENEVYKTTVYANPETLGEGIDWQDMIFRSAPMQSHQVSVAGGTEKTQFALSGNYFKQEGVIINSDFTRYSFRLNFDHRVNNAVKVGASMLTSFVVNNSIPTGSSSIDAGAVTTSILGAAMGAPPTLKPYDENGNILPFGDQMNSRYREVVNPLGLAQILNRDKINRTLGNLYAEITPLKGLTYRANFSPILSSSLNDYYSPRSIVNSGDLSSGAGKAQKNNSNTLVLLFENIVTYETRIGKEHSLKATGVFATQSNNANSNSINASNFPNDATANEAVQLATIRTVNSNRSKDRLDSYMGRINYGFRDKYLLDLIARVDGSTKFGENNKYGFFPAAAFAWRASEEPFIKNINAISNLKLRLSYGTTGNAGAIDAYKSLSLQGTSGQYYFNHEPVTGISPTGIANKDLKWERSVQADFGFDLGLFRDRLNVTADIYHKKTDDLLFVRALPGSSGYADVTGNFASMENRGVEFSADAIIVDRAVRWSVAGNISFNKNKLLSLAGGLDEYAVSNYQVMQIGQPLGLFKTYVFDGIYQTGETVLDGSGSRTGGVKVKDLNGDKVISAADQEVVGNANPDFIYGFSTNLSYRQFDFSAFFTGTQGNKVYNLTRYSFENPLGSRNMYAALVDRWSPTNPSNEYVSGFQGGRLPLTDRFMEDGSFLRCKNITLGYRVPKIKGISSARVYVSANNLFTVTKYTGFDPEVNSFGNSNKQIGVDNLVYPTARSFLVGLQVGF
ncbi:TonB-linked outer membrane protein, SusC/RagA family [Chitinophaga jiangningensis]|uniref:TonB-linked outer membrane protein, SusC/RagA family n=1 Tax=Chitinophaga jiangningensis TaxID=1419482 RepID=A0A1M7L7P1_9BACT|nr:TonB-dependent receptor [Chitinophaga jiangningensis]SHM73900.1 TonB-linked outer membrane protein, SusC/RagA family [Chitinophaga jiangningensis]